MSVRRREAGLSLIELTIGSLLGLLIVAAAGQLFLQGSRGVREDERAARMHDELRFAMSQLTRDLEMAGWWGGLDPATLHLDTSAANVGGDCATGIALALRARGDASAGDAHAAFPCIATAEFHAGPRAEGSDVIAIQRVAGTSTPAAGLQAGRVYLRTEGARSMLFLYAASGAPLAAAADYYEYRPAIWYLRSYSVSADESPRVPALCRKLLAASGSRMQSDPGGCVAQGIEDLQLELGFDGDGDGSPERWAGVSASLPAETLAQAVAVRVHLLARTLEADPRYVNLKSWRLGSRRHAPFRDGFQRSVLSALALLRNPGRRLAPPQLP